MKLVLAGFNGGGWDGGLDHELGQAVFAVIACTPRMHLCFWGSGLTLLVALFLECSSTLHIYNTVL